MIQEKRSNVKYILFQNVFTPMERTAATYAVYSVLTRHVIDSMEDVYLVV